MPRCPRCERKFRTYEQVVHHINQPRGSCVRFVDDLVDNAMHSAHTRPAKLRKIISASSSSDLETHMANLANMPQALQDPEPLMRTLDDPVPIHTQNLCTEPDSSRFNFNDDSFSCTSDSFPTPTRHFEQHPSAAKAFGAGSTFMNKFDNDQHSNYRKENLFYPFASREEWQLASFLLRSGMSMALINEFLSLDLVWDIEHCDFITSKHEYFRFGRHPCPFEAQKFYGALQSCCLPDRNGRVNRGLLNIPRKHQYISITEMQLNV